MHSLIHRPGRVTHPASLLSKQKEVAPRLASAVGLAGRHRVVVSASFEGHSPGKWFVDSGESWHPCGTLNERPC